MEGVTTALVNLATETASVEYESNTLTPDEIQRKIKALGYQPSLKNDHLHEIDGRKEAVSKQYDFIFAVLCSFPLVWAMAAHIEWITFIPVPKLFLHPWFQFALATFVQFYLGRSFFVGAFFAIRSSKPNMDVLIILGTSVAYFYSIYLSIQWSISSEPFPMLYFETSALLITFVKLGKWLEFLTRGRTSSAIRKLKTAANLTCNIAS